jgi:cytoskeletal protein RodZ
MATRRKRNLNFLPAETRPEPVIDISAYPVDIGVGELMRLTRERLGHELQTVANQLRIRLSYLEAIEEARFRDLPGTTYAVGFVRSYADYLGLDGADIVRRFREEAARIHGQTKLIFPALTAEGKLPRAAVLLVSAVGLAAVYGVWYYVSSRQQTNVPVITEVPERLAVVAPDNNDSTGHQGATAAETLDTPETPAVTEPPAPSDSGPGVANAATPHEPPVEATAPAGGGDTAVPAAPVSATPQDTTPPAETAAQPVHAHPAPAPTESSAPAPAPAAGTSAPSPVTDAGDHQTAAAVPSAAETASPATPPAPSTPPAAPTTAANEIPAAPAPPQSTAAESSSPSQPAIAPTDQPQQVAEAPQGVVIEARMECWIKVVDAKGKTVMQKVLKAGESYVVPDQPGLVLRTGNAGGIDVIVGGRKAPPLGEVGTVLTKVSLEPSRLLDGTAVAD